MTPRPADARLGRTRERDAAPRAARTNRGPPTAEGDALAAILDAARAALPDGVAVRASRIDANHARMAADEARHVAGAVDQRRREFAGGRSCARAALASLGVHARSIPAGALREPVWPDGIVGSITHDGDYCVAAVQRRTALGGLGIDLTDTTPLDPALVDRICTCEDRRALAGAEVGEGGCDPFKVVFSVKEAAYKCLFPRVRQVFGFLDVAVLLRPRDASADIRLLIALPGVSSVPPVRCRFRVAAGHIFSAAWIEADAGDRRRIKTGSPPARLEKLAAGAHPTPHSRRRLSSCSRTASRRA